MNSRLRSAGLSTLAAIAVLVVALLVRQQPSGQAARAATPVVSRAGHVTVKITDFAFAPKTLTVKAGTRVTWTNHDDTPHTATADGGAFGTGNIDSGKSRTIDLRKPGTYAYHCQFHAFMTATITVVR